MISLHHNHHITVSHCCQSCLVFWKGEKHGSSVCFRCNLFWSSVQQCETKKKNKVKKTAVWYITVQLTISEFNHNCSGAVVLDGVLYCREQVHGGCAINSPSMQDSLVITQYGKMFYITQRWVYFVCLQRFQKCSVSVSQSRKTQPWICHCTSLEWLPDAIKCLTVILDYHMGAFVDVRHWLKQNSDLFWQEITITSKYHWILPLSPICQCAMWTWSKEMVHSDEILLKLSKMIKDRAREQTFPKKKQQEFNSSHSYPINILLQESMKNSCCTSGQKTRQSIKPICNFWHD